VTPTTGFGPPTTVERSLDGAATPMKIVFAHDFGNQGTKPKPTIQIQNKFATAISLDAILILK
jgi:hypothetical protein